MPSKPSLADFRILNGTICHSCLYSIRRQAAALPLAAAYHSIASPNRVAIRRPSQVNNGLQRLPSKTEMQSFIKGIEELGKDKVKDDSDDVSVRFFEQDEKGRKELDDEEAFGDSLNGFDTSAMKDALAGLESRLETQEEKSAFRQVLHEMHKGIRSVSSQKDLKKMLASMDDYNKSIDDELKQMSFQMPEEMVEGLQKNLVDLAELELADDDVDDEQGYLEEDDYDNEPPRRTTAGTWNANQRKKVSRLNSELERVAWRLQKGAKLTAKEILGVYRAWKFSRECVAKRWNSVPLDVWNMLWTVLSIEGPTNPNRLAHISQLAKDMRMANVCMSPSQQLTSIEALHADGWESQGVDMWKRYVSTLGDQGAETHDGFWTLGVHMFCGQGDMEQAERCASRLLSKGQDAHILLPIIEAWSVKETAEGRDKAWKMYRRMRELLGNGMKLAEYDEVISCFLTTNQEENGLQAFVDMMLGDKVDVKGLGYMPPVVGNKFFLGKWLKRLIGARDLDGAHKVVRYMRSKGVEAAPMQINGLIGAWQRSGGVRDLELADQTAWEMIEARIAFVRARQAGQKEVRGGGPRATLETFSLLAENYRLRDLRDKMQRLWEGFREAQIGADAFMMNQLLELHIQAGYPEKAVALYETLVTQGGTTPDAHTFSALWKTLAVNQLLHVGPDALETERQATRRLFAQTVRHRAIFTSQGGMDGQLARKILHALRRLRDGPGVAVALAALRDLLGFVPADLLALEMVLGTTRLAWDTGAQRSRLMRAKRELDAGLRHLVGDDTTRLDDGEQRGRVVCAFLQQRFLAEAGEGAEGLVPDVARQMGVDELLGLQASSHVAPAASI